MLQSNLREFRYNLWLVEQYSFIHKKCLNSKEKKFDCFMRIHISHKYQID